MSIYWYEYKRDGKLTVAQPRYTLAEYWKLYKATYSVVITLDGHTCSGDNGITDHYLCSDLGTRILMYPLPTAIGKTTRARLQLAIDTGEIPCHDCRDMFAPDDLETITCDGEELALCETCRQEYSACERCSEQTHNDSQCSVNTRNSRGRTVEETWCESCRDSHAFHCDDCSDWVTDDDQVSTGNGSICQHCYENGNYTSCESCDSIGTDFRYHEGNECCYCDSCYPDDESDLIHDYSHKPTWKFHGKKGVIKYGWENELTINRDMAQDILDSLGGEDHAFLKEDSSIVGGGFEVVSHPHTLAEHRTQWASFFAMKRRGKGNENGMHVHIQRKYLSTMQVQMMQSFLNLESNFEFVKLIAQRDPSRWGKCNTELGKVSTRGGYDRYSALNLCNRNTVEVRIFRGTVKQSEFFKNLEFCDALVKFCKCRSYRELTPAAFAQFVRANRKEYLNLDNYLVENNLLVRVPAKKEQTACA